MKLRFEPIDALFLLLEDRLEELAGAVVALVATHGDARVQTLDRVVLDFEVEAVLLDRIFADLDGEVALHIGHAFEEEDAGDDRVRVLHLLERLPALFRRELIEAPVLTHPVMDEVLVDGGELRGEYLVEQVDDVFVALHEFSFARSIETTHTRCNALSMKLKGVISCGVSPACRARRPRLARRAAARSTDRLPDGRRRTSCPHRRPHGRRSDYGRRR